VSEGGYEWRIRGEGGGGGDEGGGEEGRGGERERGGAWGGGREREGWEGGHGVVEWQGWGSVEGGGEKEEEIRGEKALLRAFPGLLHYRLTFAPHLSFTPRESEGDTQDRGRSDFGPFRRSNEARQLLVH